MRKWLALLLALPTALPLPSQVPNVRTTTSEVLLDFVVRDKHGNIVRNLRPDEVQVYENGVKQSMRHFEFFDGRTGEEPMLKKRPTKSARKPNSANAKPMTVNQLREMNVVSVVISALDPRGRKLTVAAMRNFVANELHPNTYVGVFGLGVAGLEVVQTYTNSAEKISSAVNKLAHKAMLEQLTNSAQTSLPNTEFGSPSTDTPNSVGNDPSTSSITGPTSAPGTNLSTAPANSAAAIIDMMVDAQWTGELHDIYTDSMHFLAPLRRLVEAQKDIPGRKVVLLFADGLPLQGDTSSVLGGVISAANRANVTIYAVDTNGYTSISNLENARRLLNRAAQASRQQQLSKIEGLDQTVFPSEVLSTEMGDTSIGGDSLDNLRVLAEGTGGELLPASLDLREPLRRAMEDVQTHYELSYSPTDTNMDGDFRKISVKVSRPGVRVFARSGYFAVPMFDGRAIYPFEIATLKVINSKPALHQFDFSATALQFRPGAGQTQMAFVFQTPTSHLKIEKDGVWARVRVDVTALIKNPQGQVVDKISKDIAYKDPVERFDQLKRGELSFTAPFFLPPGHYTLVTGVVDRLSMRASTSQSPLVVTGESGFTMSDVEVARRVNTLQGPPNPADPLQARGGMVTPELSKTAPDTTAGRVMLYAVAYPQTPVDAPVHATLELYHNGRLVLRSPSSTVDLDADGAASILASVRTDRLPSGRYKAMVSFRYKTQTVAKSVAFTLGNSE